MSALMQLLTARTAPPVMKSDGRFSLDDGMRLYTAGYSDCMKGSPYQASPSPLTSPSTSPLASMYERCKAFFGDADDVDKLFFIG